MPTHQTGPGDLKWDVDQQFETEDEALLAAVNEGLGSLRTAYNCCVVAHKGSEAAIYAQQIQEIEAAKDKKAWSIPEKPIPRSYKLNPSDVLKEFPADLKPPKFSVGDKVFIDDPLLKKGLLTITDIKVSSEGLYLYSGSVEGTSDYWHGLREESVRLRDEYYEGKGNRAYHKGVEFSQNPYSSLSLSNFENGKWKAWNRGWNAAKDADKSENT